MIGWTLCSGIGAPEVAAPWVDWRLAAEIEAFPREVLQQRFGYKLPEDHNQGDPLLWGDMTEVTPDIARAHGVPLPDLLVAGTPCQAFSIAGLRGGTNDARGNLTLKFVETCHAIVDARPDGKLAVLWENVPGVLSDKGNAFGCFLGGLVGAVDALQPPTDGSWPSEGMVQGPRARLAWCVLDAQWFGVAQRRRRVFVVVDFGGSCDPAQVLLEPDCLRGDTPPRRETGQGAAGSAGTGTSHWSGGPHPSLSQSTKGSGGIGASNQELFSQGGAGLEPSQVRAARMVAFGEYSEDGSASALKARDYKDATDLVYPVGECFGLSTSVTPKFAHELSPTLTVPSPSGGGQPPEVAFDLRGRDDGAQVESVGQTVSLRAADGGSSRSYVAFAQNTRDEVRLINGDGPIAGALAAETGAKQQTYISTPAVRRLMPVECERLQGFPPKHEMIKVNLCEDARLQLNALVADGCTIVRQSAKSAGAKKKQQYVKAADLSSNTRQAELRKPAAAHVHINLEHRQVHLLSAGKLLWSAPIADGKNSSPLPIPTEDFAQLAAHMMKIAAKIIPLGKVGSQTIGNPFTTRQNGGRHLNLSGLGIEEAAENAASIIKRGWKHSTSITSPSTQPIQNEELTLKTLCFCVLSAIATSIQQKTQFACFSCLTIELVSPHTAVTYRKKPASDGPRYKALGNSMAVPVIRYIIERISK